MTWVTIGLSAATMFAMAVILSYVLGWANKAFHVEVDARITSIIDVLPGANCGGCGFVGCGDYAEAIVNDGAEVKKCPVGGSTCSAEVAGIMGVEVGESFPVRAVVHCGAHLEERLGRSGYRGEKTCAAAKLITDVQGCTYGCLGFGDCVVACNYDAISVIDGLATVDYDACIGCGACAKICARGIISMQSFKADRMMAVTCSNRDGGKDVKAVCKAGCIGCKACTRVSDSVTMEGNLAIVNYDEYDPENEEAFLKACEKCPTDRVEMVGTGEVKSIKTA
jgi:Na+-translocating ferredoxin:NAD+ oxidoreductase subunit B